MRFQYAEFPSPFTAPASPIPSPSPKPSNKPANKTIPHAVGTSVPIVPLNKAVISNEVAGGHAAGVPAAPHGK